MRLLIMTGVSGNRTPIWRQLVAAGLEVDQVRGSSEARDMLAHGRHDVALIDVPPSDREARELLAERRAGQHVPVIALIPAEVLARCKPELLSHVDDWVPKPVSMSELMARMRAVLHRAGRGETRVHRAGALVVSADARQVTFAGTALALSMRERAALSILVRHLAHPVPRARLDAVLYGHDGTPSPNATEALMSRLRRSLRTAGCPARISAVRGIGWRLTIPEPDGDLPR